MKKYLLLSVLLLTITGCSVYSPTPHEKFCQKKIRTFRPAMSHHSGNALEDRRIEETSFYNMLYPQCTDIKSIKTNKDNNNKGRSNFLNRENRERSNFLKHYP